MLVELFQVLYEIVNALRVEKLLTVSDALQVIESQTFRITWEGSVLSIAFKYCCIAVS